MKTISSLYLLLLAVLFLSCSSENEITSSRESVITFGLSPEASRAIPDGSTLLFSLQSSSGEIIFDEQVVELTRNGDVLASEKIAVPEGDYELTDFMIIHQEEVIYAAPRVASELSDRTATPLSHQINVSSSRDRVVEMDVLQTSGKASRKFGYDSFKKPSRNTWRIALYVIENGEEVLTSGHASLVRPDGTSIGYTVNGMTTIVYEGDPDFAWTLVAGKSGYEAESVPFVFSQIPGHGMKPFKFVLEPLVDEGSFAFSPQGIGTFEFEVGFMGSGTLSIEWGNGFSQVESFTSADPSAITTRHIIVDITEEVPIVNVTGDLDQIISYRNFSVYSTYLDVSGLSELRNLFIEGAVLDNLDLSGNPKLVSLQINGSTIIYGTELGDHPGLNYIKVNVLGSGIEDLIHEIGQNTVNNNIHGGTFSYDEESVFYNPLTPESVAILENLEQNYGWTIIYQPIQN